MLSAQVSVIMCQRLQRMRLEESMDREVVHAELRRASTTFHQLLDSANADDLFRRSSGTRWTNEQLLFHMLFGYIVVLALLPMVRAFGRLPPGASRAWSRLLTASTRPFDLINCWGAVGGVRVYDHRRMGAKFDHTIAALSRRLEAEPDSTLARTMHFPVRWDPFFKDAMTLEDVYRYPTQHFDFHRDQLNLGTPSGSVLREGGASDWLFSIRPCDRHGSNRGLVRVSCSVCRHGRRASW
ncbi:DinB family protein [Streptomyces sp. NBC_00687]|uniref:DinB family protein n=1 Tax=Streptomyces sp. NBC_00687 TaxID=2975807 RepID=UPI0022582857|nr:DinB family protein [Streptomyces sp. NBC_00687]MCX4919958.1 DinB family protein [Streptomyces sp. NBC_00687]